MKKLSSPEDVLEPPGGGNCGVEVPHLALVPLLAHRIGSEELRDHSAETA